jgi:hypothetical protein
MLAVIVVFVMISVNDGCIVHITYFYQITLWWSHRITFSIFYFTSFIVIDCCQGFLLIRGDELSVYINNSIRLILMLKSLHESHRKFLLSLYNRSFSECFQPAGWKDTRVVLLAKKTHICEPSDTRPISLHDTFQKIGEKLFLSRYKKVLDRLGLLPVNQSGFHEKNRLQTRVLLFIDEIFNHLANSSPVAIIFVDFKRAFDMLWHEECV